MAQSPGSVEKKPRYVSPLLYAWSVPGKNLCVCKYDVTFHMNNKYLISEIFQVQYYSVVFNGCHICNVL